MLKVLKDRSFYSTMFAIAIPMALQGVISFGVNLMDTVMVGKFGEVALSATSLAGTFFQSYGSICMGLGCGAGVITAQYWGAKEIEPIKQMTSICIKATLMLTVIFMIFGLGFPKQVLSLYTSEEDVIIEGARYLRVLAFGFILTGLSTAATQILRSVGEVRIQLIATIVAFFANILFNYMFIFGKLGAPRLEVVGAAIGTLIARFFECAIIFGYMVFKDKKIGFRLKDLHGFNRELFRKYVSAGLPVLISDILMTISYNLTSVIIGHVGAEFTAANSIANVVNNVIFSLFFGVSTASSVVVGNKIGERDYKKAYSYGFGYLCMCVFMGVIGGVLLMLIKWPIINIYDVSETTKLYTGQMIDVMAIMLSILLLDHVLAKGVLRGGGDTKFMIIADCVFGYCVAAPLGYLAAFVFCWPCWAIYLCLKMESVCKVILCGWRFFSKRWIKDFTVKDATVEKVELN